MNKNKQTLKDTFNEALKHYKEKNFENALYVCNKILSIDTNHFDSILLLSNIFAVNRDFAKAKEFLYRALEIQPKNLTVINNLGTTYKELGDFEKSRNYYEKVLAIDPNHVNAHFNMGILFYKLKDLKKAKEYFQKTTLMQGNYAFAFFSLGNVETDLKEYENAIRSFQKAIEINPKLPGPHNNLGLVFRTLNDFENAISCYKKVIEIKPNHAGALHNLAQTYKEMGKFDKAIESHEEAIKHEPNNTSHYYYLSELKKNILDSSLKIKINKLLENKKSTRTNHAYGNYILAKYERETKNYENEMKYLIKGHKNFFESRKEKFDLGIKYCFDDVLQITEGVNFINSSKTKDYDIRPIYIIGVPRCGSTLVEKIIASGQDFIPIGEETSVLENYINAKILEKQSLNLGDIDQIREEVLNLYKQKGLISKKYKNIFTDKSLNNFFYLEFIKEVYPNAKIINCNRNKISSIMSIFQNNLTELAWTHSLENIFKYFDNYFAIIEAFNDTHPNLIYDLQFEDLIENPEEESKKLMHFCELPWDKKCLEFYKRKDLISKTTSNIQIRRSIYKQKTDKYSPYKKFLDKYGKKYTWYN
tara:strand:- start:2394 stop:4160 length:1767 start_codon:yes stop_codon:yes gene_type:complete